MFRHHFSKNFSSAIKLPLHLCQKTMATYVWVHFWILCFVSLIDTCILMLMPHCLFFLASLLECNYFTMVCYFLLYNKVNQLYIYIYPHISSLLHLPPILPIPLLQVLTKQRANFPLAMRLLPTSYPFYIWWCIYVHATLSLNPSLPFPLPVSSSPFSTSASLFLSCP